MNSRILVGSVIVACLLAGCGGGAASPSGSPSGPASASRTPAATASSSAAAARASVSVTVGPTRSASAGAGTSAGSSGQRSSAAGAGGQAVDWPVYHHDAARSGFGSELPQKTSASQVWSADVDGVVYAEPLAAQGRVYVATENDTAYALDANTGKVLWQQHLGEPVPRSALPCGNIDPSGITATPALDTASGTLYLSGRFQPTHHELVALDAATGSVKFRRTIDPPGADPRYLQERSALALGNGRLYIAFGGNFGDCGPYHGWVVSSPLDSQGSLQFWGVPTEREGAIWAPAGPVIDANGDILVAIGNAASTSQFDYGNAVVRLSPQLQVKDYWAPSDWAALSRADRDIGSVSPSLVDGQIFQTGKNGQGYLLNAAKLGKIGGEAFSSKICSSSFGSTAYQPPVLYVPCTDSLLALRIRPGAFDVAWKAPLGGLNGPIVAYGAVWVVDSSAPALVNVDPATGQLRARLPLPGPVVAHFVTPTAADGKIFVTSGPHVLAFS